MEIIEVQKWVMSRIEFLSLKKAWGDELVCNSNGECTLILLYDDIFAGSPEQETSSEEEQEEVHVFPDHELAEQEDEVDDEEEPKEEDE